MNFKLDPPSGLADSYLDIEFYVTYNKSHKTVLTIYNNTCEEQLNILGVSSGYILHDNMVIIKNDTKIIGHINIFNDDKMNQKFSLYSYVKLTCKLEHFNNEDKSIGTEEKSIIFYNEGHSLDATIIPFDLVTINNVINIDNNDPLRIDIISGLERGYEICVQSSDKKSLCHLEIAAKNGKTSIEIPLEILYHDLQLDNNKNKLFQIYYVKFQGATYSRLANRKYILINNSDIKFTGSHKFTPKPQSRIGPTGKLIDNRFILSDRYLVLCPREYSGFSKKLEFSHEKLMDLTMMVNEGQNMVSVARQIQQFSTRDTDNVKKIQKTQRTIQRMKGIRPKISINQIQLMKSISGAYEPISRTTINSPFSVKRFASTQSPDSCLPCSRKRKKNA